MFILSTARALNLDWFKILSFGKGINFLQVKGPFCTIIQSVVWHNGSIIVRVVVWYNALQRCIKPPFARVVLILVQPAARLIDYFNDPEKWIFQTHFGKEENCVLIPAFSRFPTILSSLSKTNSIIWALLFLRTKSVTQKQMNKCMAEI